MVMPGVSYIDSTLTSTLPPPIFNNKPSHFQQ